MNQLRRWSLNLGAACLLLAAPSFSVAQTAAATAKDTAKKSGKTAPASPVDLNTASQAELESVPGIGTATAKKIIAARPYSSVADLSKASLSAKQIQGISSMVKVGAVPASTAKSATPAPAPMTKPTPAGKAVSTANTPGTQAAGGGAGKVWVNTETKVFHREGDKWYGTTKHGKYMTEADAVKAGYHESKEKNKT